MTFCTRCGHKNEPAAKFCEECGIAMASKASVTTPTPIPQDLVPQTSSAPRVNRNLLKFSIMTLALLVTAGVGLFFMLAPESPSNAIFAKAIERSLLAKPQSYKARFCLVNFAYDRDPARIDERDESTTRWLNLLKAAGLYGEPERVVSQSFFNETVQLVYPKTEAGKAATKTGQLCVAGGVTVTEIESFTPPEKMGDLQMSRTTVKMKLRDPMPWVLTEAARAASNIIKPDFSEDMMMVLKDGKWQVADDLDAQAAVPAQRNQKMRASAKSSSDTGFLDSILNFFHSGNPLIGRWESKFMGIVAINYEFTSSSMISSGAKTNVRFEVEGDRVTVYPEGAGGIGIIFNVVDKNTLTMNAGLAEMTLTRTK